jgi:hypothetical protein
MIKPIDFYTLFNSNKSYRSIRDDVFCLNKKIISHLIKKISARQSDRNQMIPSGFRIATFQSLEDSKVMAGIETKDYRKA